MVIARMLIRGGLFTLALTAGMATANSLWLVRHGKRLFASTPLSALDISEQ